MNNKFAKVAASGLALGLLVGIAATPSYAIPPTNDDAAQHGGYRGGGNRGGGDNGGNRGGGNRGGGEGGNRGGGDRGGQSRPAAAPAAQPRASGGGRDWNRGNDGQAGGGRDWNRGNNGQTSAGRDNSGRDNAGRWTSGNRPGQQGGGANGNGGRDQPNSGGDRGGRDHNDRDHNDRNHNGGWNGNNSNGGWNGNRDRDRDRGNSGRNWNRGHGNYHFDYRSDRRFRGYTGLRLGFYYAPTYGYYRVPSQWYGHRWGMGEYLPDYFFRYRIYDYMSYGLPTPPYDCGYYFVGQDIVLVDMSTGQIIDVFYDVY